VLPDLRATQFQSINHEIIFGALGIGQTRCIGFQRGLGQVHFPVNAYLANVLAVRLYVILALPRGISGVHQVNVLRGGGSSTGGRGHRSGLSGRNRHQEQQGASYAVLHRSESPQRSAGGFLWLPTILPVAPIAPNCPGFSVNNHDRLLLSLLWPKGVPAV